MPISTDNKVAKSMSDLGDVMSKIQTEMKQVDAAIASKQKEAATEEVKVEPASTIPTSPVVEQEPTATQSARSAQTQQFNNQKGNAMYSNVKGEDSKKWGFIAGGFGGGTYDIVSDGLVKLSTTMNDMIANRIRKSDKNTRVIPLDRNNYLNVLPVDALLVVTTEQDENKNVTGASAYAILLTTTDNVHDTVEDTLAGGRRVEVDVHTSQFFADKTRAPSFFRSLLEGMFPGDVLRTYAGGSCLFTNVLDTSNDETVLSVLVNAMAATLNNLQETRNRLDNQVNDINLANRTTDEVLTIDRQITNGVIVDAHGLPTRGDFVFTLGSRTISNANGIAGGTGKVEAARVVGYYDFLPYEDRSSNDTLSGTNNPWARSTRRLRHQDEDASRRNLVSFAVNTVITGIVTNQYHYLGVRLLALIAAIDANQTNFWWANYAIDPRNHPRGWMHSIAGTGYEIALRHDLPNFAPIPVDDAKFDDRAYDEYVATYLYPEMIYSLEYAVGSSFAWRLDEFQKAAIESDEEAMHPNSYNSLIIRTANNMTNGLFAKHFAELGGTRVMMNNMPNRRLLSGMYHNQQTGTVRSLQDIDRRFLLNQVNGQEDMMHVVEDATVALVDPSLSSVQCLGLWTEVVKSTVTHADITGSAVRRDFTTQFITALHRAVVECGTQLEYSSNQPVTSSTQRTAMYINSGLVGQMTGTAMVAPSGRSGKVSYFG